LQIPFIEENVTGGFLVQPGDQNDPAKRAEKFVQILELKKSLEDAQESFVVDRCPADLLNFWFAMLLHTKVDSTEFIERCEKYTQAYDFIILLPFGVLPVEQKSDLSIAQRNMGEWKPFEKWHCS